MTRQFYPGASYNDAWPAGECARLYQGSHLETHTGRVELPAGEGFGLMFLKCFPSTPFRFGGKNHDSGDVSLIQEWRADTGWGPRVSSPTGRCVYVNGGLLVDTLPTGYQYVDEATGLPVSYNLTYGPLNGLSEWCKVADLQIGQVHDSLGPPAIALWDGTAHRLIHNGLGFFVNAHRIGEDVAISFVVPGGAWTVRATLAELRALPLLVPPTPEPPDPEPPDPPDPPKPEPPNPEPEPPIPPAQKPYPPIVGVTMQTERGWLIGPGDKALSCDANGRVSFDRTDLTEQDLLEAAPVEGDYRATVRSVAHPDRYVTADATQHAPGGNPCLAFYGAAKGDVFGPDGKPGWYQRWAFGQWESGIVTAGVDYVEQGANHGRPFKSPQLTWVKA